MNDTIIQNEIVKSLVELQLKKKDLSPSYLEAMTQAKDYFVSTGLPTKKHEDWKYSSLVKNIAPRFYYSKNNQDENVLSSADYKENFNDLVIDNESVLIFNNGYFDQINSKLPTGLEIDQLIPLMPSNYSYHDVFDALNFASSLTPLSLKIKKGMLFSSPLTIIHYNDELTANKMTSSRLNFSVEENAEIQVLEIYLSNNKNSLPVSTNHTTNWNLARNAKVEFVKLHLNSPEATHIGAVGAELKRDAHFHSYTIDLGTLSSRHNITTNLSETGAESTVHGIYSLTKKNHSDIFSTIIHSAPQTFSDQLVKGLLNDESHGVFTGKIIVKKDAQQIQSNQLNKNLLLSKKAHIDTRPQLLVSADDVKCSHGATIGQLLPDEEFYLRSRGISTEQAKAMLSLGFIAEVTESIKNTHIKKLVNDELKKTFWNMNK